MKNIYKRQLVAKYLRGFFAIFFAGLFSLAPISAYSIEWYERDSAYQEFFNANILGRSLNYRGMGWLGHVGIWHGQSRRVLEVVNESSVVSRVSTAPQFISSSTYWGKKYHLELKREPPSNKYRLLMPEIWERNNINERGYNQRNFQPKYTTTALYKVGKYESKKVWNPTKKKYETIITVIPAKFRCDTFVAWSYEAGLDSHWKSLFTIPMTPANLFNSSNLKLW